MKSVGTLVFCLARLTVGAALMAAVVGIACLGGQETNGERAAGISDDQILFGQSAVFSGSSQALGREMRLGIEAAFYEVNQAGGVHGRELKLETLNDAYDPDLAFHTTRWLIEKAQVFALIGAVGRPVSRVAAPLAHDAGVPFRAPFTGAEFLRDPALDNVVNLRASYYQETEAMIARLTEDLGVTRVPVFYQGDAFGANGLEGVRRALKRRGLEPVGSWHYQRNSGAVRPAAASLVEANPEGIVTIGTPEAVATATKLVHHDLHPVFMTVSFVGGRALAKGLGDDGHGVYVTQVAPFPEDAASRWLPDITPPSPVTVPRRNLGLFLGKSTSPAAWPSSALRPVVASSAANASANASLRLCISRMSWKSTALS